MLWPSLLECLVPETFTHAMNPLCRCICHLATKKREEQADDFAIDFEAKSMSYTIPHTLFQKTLDNVIFYRSERKRICFKFDTSISRSEFVGNQKRL